MSLNSIQKLSFDRSPKERLPNVRTPLSPFNEVSFDFRTPTTTHDSDSSYEEAHKSQPKTSVSTVNLSRPFSWAVLEDSDTTKKLDNEFREKLDNEFRELIECHQGEINCI